MAKLLLQCNEGVLNLFDNNSNDVADCLTKMGSSKGTSAVRDFDLWNVQFVSHLFMATFLIAKFCIKINIIIK